jgi:hypothetical protein
MQLALAVFVWGMIALPLADIVVEAMQILLL